MKAPNESGINKDFTAKSGVCTYEILFHCARTTTYNGPLL